MTETWGCLGRNICREAILSQGRQARGNVIRVQGGWKAVSEWESSANHVRVARCQIVKGILGVSKVFGFYPSVM